MKRTPFYYHQHAHLHDEAWRVRMREADRRAERAGHWHRVLVWVALLGGSLLMWWGIVELWLALMHWVRP